MTHDELRKLIARAVFSEDDNTTDCLDCLESPHACACMAKSERIADAILAALTTAGLAIVPVEATEAMLVDGAKALRDFYRFEAPYPRTRSMYRAMLAASPFTKETGR